MKYVSILALAAALISGCGIEPAHAPEASVLLEEPSGAPLDVVVDLISPATCATVGDTTMGKCAVDLTLPEPIAYPSRVPVITTYTVERHLGADGNACKTAFPLELGFTSGTVDLGNRPFVGGQDGKLQRPGFAPIKALRVKSAGAWWPTATFRKDCRMALRLRVDAAAVSDATIAAWKTELQAAVTERADDMKSRDAYAALLALHSMYSFMNSLAETFFTPLTTGSMHALRAEAPAQLVSIKKVRESCDKPNPPPISECEVYDELIVTLGSLADDAKWKKPDGSYKALSDFHVAAHSAILQKIGTYTTDATVAGYEERVNHFAQQVIAGDRLIAELEILIARTW